MRINVYAEELTDRIELVEKVIDGTTFYGLRFYLELPVTVTENKNAGTVEHVAGPFLHRPGDDDSSAVTFWSTDLADLTRLFNRAEIIVNHTTPAMDEIPEEAHRALSDNHVLRSKLQDARNRLDTIRETNPEISLDHDIERVDAVLAETTVGD